MGDRNDKAMIALAPNSVQRDDRIIPSGVRLERPKMRQNVWREALASTLYHIVEIGGIIRNGKLHVVKVGSPNCGGDGVGGLIQSGPELGKSIISEVGEPVWKSPRHLDLVGLANAVRVCFDHSGIRFFFEEFVDPTFECIDMALCTR
jgi:hypothetical protein